MPIAWMDDLAVSVVLWLAGGEGRGGAPSPLAVRSIEGFASERVESVLARVESVLNPLAPPGAGSSLDMTGDMSPARDARRFARGELIGAAWAWEIQPQGREFDYFRLVFDFYRTLRRLGLSVDFVPADTPSLEGYRLVVIPGLFTWTPALLGAINASDGHVLIGPRSGSKTGISPFRRPCRQPCRMMY